MSFEGFPFVVGWELTLCCNLRCAHCGSSAGYARGDELTLEESLGLCDQMPELLVQHAINSAFSVAVGMPPEDICLSTVPPDAAPAPCMFNCPEVDQR